MGAFQRQVLMHVISSTGNQKKKKKVSQIDYQ